ncbi:hypothetical protein [Anaerobium acetethylicum]|uniref:DNA alkylation repair enzyme n=1 Tax=Anaerobium acetethylicum TaxID=1619234 RepID=A0A1D3TQ62_9FIRM|nr:hypothetical protein [Anaerobium acetethylicum]SCP95645.1 hypothetical protein SAMN05421730_100283 [Anaerobium acetethylicum]
MNAVIKRDEMIQTLKAKPDVLDLVDKIMDRPKLIPVFFDIIRSEKSSIKFLCEKVLRKISEDYPDILYPYFEDIAGLIDSDNNFIKWGGIITLSNLVLSDSEKKFLKVYDKYFSMLDSETMITAANAAGNAWKIAKKYPDLEPDVTKRLLGVSENTYYNKGEPSPECKNILYGDIIECFDRYFKKSSCQKEILEFVEQQKDNPRNSVAKKAEAFLKKHRKEEA